MKFVVQIVIADENVYRNSGCAMVIGKRKKISESSSEINLQSIVVIVMMEVMKIHVIVVCKKKRISLLFEIHFFERITSSSTLL